MDLLIYTKLGQGPDNSAIVVFLALVLWPLRVGVLFFEGLLSLVVVVVVVVVFLSAFFNKVLGFILTTFTF